MVLKMLKTIVWSVFSSEYVTRPHGESAFEKSHGKFSFMFLFISTMFFTLKVLLDSSDYVIGNCAFRFSTAINFSIYKEPLFLFHRIF